MNRWCKGARDARHSSIQREWNGRAALVCGNCGELICYYDQISRTVGAEIAAGATTFELVSSSLKDEGEPVRYYDKVTLGKDCVKTLEEAEELRNWLTEYLIPKLLEEDRIAFLAKRGKPS